MDIMLAALPAGPIVPVAFIIPDVIALLMKTVLGLRDELSTHTSDGF